MFPEFANVLEDPARRTPVKIGADRSASIELSLGRGVHRLHAEIDARDFDWERLFIPMTRFGNTGQMTGPWDFDVNDHHRPLLPAWWVCLDGRDLGLAVVPRPSIAEYDARRFSLNAGFHVPNPGSHHLSLKPYRADDQITIDHLDVAPAPERDALPLPEDSVGDPPSLAAHQADQHHLRNWRKRIDADSEFRRIYQAARQTAKEVAVTHERQRSDGVHRGPAPEALLLLAFTHLSDRDEEAWRICRNAIESLIGQPHWGNPHADGFGHDCDLEAAAILAPLTFLYHWEKEALQQAGLRSRLKDKLDLQMRRFCERMLLQEDYWGGSILQDHGLRSITRFGAAACNMLGVLDEAGFWFGLANRHLHRTLDALPRDGAIPHTSYGKIHLYMDDMVAWRDAYLHVSGHDVFQRPVFPKIVEFLWQHLDTDTETIFLAHPRGDRRPLAAGWGFFNAIASAQQNPIASHLAKRILSRHLDQERVPLRPLATLLDAVKHAPDSPRPLFRVPSQEGLHVYRDSGIIQYRVSHAKAQVSVICPAHPAISSRLHTNNGPDRVGMAPLAGHFTVAIAGRPLLVTAEGGYRMTSALAMVLLIDGEGGHADRGFVMGAFNIPWRGEHIQTATYDPNIQVAHVRLELHQTYRREQRIRRYHREFLLTPSGFTVRDSLLADIPHQYGWRLHAYQRCEVSRTGQNECRVADGDAAIEINNRGQPCQLEVRDEAPDIVWAYGHDQADAGFHEIAYDTHEPSKDLAIEWNFRWS